MKVTLISQNNDVELKKIQEQLRVLQQKIDLLTNETAESMASMNTTANELNDRLIDAEDWIAIHKTDDALEKKSRKKTEEIPTSEDIVKIKEYLEVIPQLFRTKECTLTIYAEAMRFYTIVQVMVEGSDPRSIETIHDELYTNYGARSSYIYLLSIQYGIKSLNRPNLMNAVTAIIKMFEADLVKKKPKAKKKCLEVTHDEIREEEALPKTESKDNSDVTVEEDGDFIDTSPFEKDGDTNPNL